MEITIPHTLPDLVKAKVTRPTSVLLAGGTDLLAQWKSPGDKPAQVILLENVKELSFISKESAVLEIGAMTSHTEILEFSDIRRLFPALFVAASSIGAPAVRNMGTIGGNIANASPAADLVPALMIYGAKVNIVGINGERTVPLKRFFIKYREVDLKKEELIKSVSIPFPANYSFSKFYKLGLRKAQTISKASLAGCLELEDKVVKSALFAAGSVAEIPLIIKPAENEIVGKVLTHALAESIARSASELINPIDDVRSTAAYRKYVIGVLVRRFITEAMAHFSSE